MKRAAHVCQLRNCENEVCTHGDPDNRGRSLHDHYGRRDARDAHLVDYLLASNAETLKDFPSGDSGHTTLTEALEVFRVMAGSVSLQGLSEKNRLWR
jgi:hypothetical protein